jgi:sulfate adenylyltransferase large subunit
MDLLRFSTAGSVDDGKSTLIGRLLYDSKGVFEDQLEAVARSKVNRASQGIDLSLLTDGLRAEREQGITIDVAYRYFSTPRRKFIIADTPGHEQYTRNMATGASTAHLAIVLIDARYGALVQSRRHTFIASLLGIPHLVVAVNKMDLVGFSQARFDEIRVDFARFVAQLGFREVTWIPLSALTGDNVVHASASMAWHTGKSLLDHLETVDVAGDENLRELRFPVQYVVRPNLDYRGFAGQIASGVVRKGDEVLCLPAGTRSRVKRIDTYDGELAAAAAPRSVTLLLDDEIDVSRGDLIVHPQARPWSLREVEADVVWMSPDALDPQRPYLLKHAGKTVRARVQAVLHRVDVNTLERTPADALQLNEIGRLRLGVAQPLHADAYQHHRRTGCFVVIDPLTNGTVAAGMISPHQPDAHAGEGAQHVDRAQREAQAGHKAALLWLRAAGEGRSDLAKALELRLFQRGVNVVVLDRALTVGVLAGCANPDERARRLAALVEVLLQAGLFVIADLDEPDAMVRDAMGRVIEPEDFLEFAAEPVDSSAGSAPTVAGAVAWLADRGVFSVPRVVSPGAGI